MNNDLNEMRRLAAIVVICTIIVVAINAIRLLTGTF